MADVAAREGLIQVMRDLLAAQAAGCDVVLACNDMDAADQLLERWRPPPSSESARRMQALAGRPVGPRQL